MTTATSPAPKLTAAVAAEYEAMLAAERAKVAEAARERRALAEFAVQSAQKQGLSSIHIIFPTDEEATELESFNLGLFRRKGMQYHWKNPGYRTYDESDLRMLQQIRTLQDFGFDLEETRPFVDCLRAGHPVGDACPASLAVYRRKLGELDALIEQLRTVRTEVGAQLARAELEASAELPGGPEPRCELGG